MAISSRSRSQQRPRWRNIFNGGCLGDWSTRHGWHCSSHSSLILLAFLAPCPFALFHPRHPLPPLLYFSNNLWKRSVEISRRWHFSTFHDCFRERISFYYIRSLTSFGCSVEIPDRGWNSVNVLSKFSRLEYRFRDSRILWRQVFSKITNKSSSVHLLKVIARRLNDVETNYLKKIQRSLRELEGVE